jgi:hypothetical protein
MNSMPATRVGYHFATANVPDEESPLASGVAPAREAESAGDMPEVPKGRGFAPSVPLAVIIVFHGPIRHQIALASSFASRSIS